MVLPFISLSSTYNISETAIPESDDGTSDAIPIPDTVGFPFSNVSQDTIYVSCMNLNRKNIYLNTGSNSPIQIGTNGLISFGSAYNSFSNQVFPGSVSASYLVAPFWDDVDIRGGNGEISYEIHESGYYLDHVSGFLRYQRPSQFEGSWMIIAYWDAVHPFFGASNPEVLFFVLHSRYLVTLLCNITSLLGEHISSTLDHRWH